MIEDEGHAATESSIRPDCDVRFLGAPTALIDKADTDSRGKIISEPGEVSDDLAFKEDGSVLDGFFCDLAARNVSLL